MLFILTGNVQIGKTRWLQALCSQLTEAGSSVAGVLAPGDWVKRPEGQLGTEADRGLSGEGAYEKRGIFNLLLPENTLIPFARRADLAQVEGTATAQSQSAKAGLGWQIDDSAIARVNLHFDELGQRAVEGALPPGGLLVVDELGRLELMRGEGLTSAVRLLEAGPCATFPHALIVVREQLLDLALTRFPAWGPAHPIAPTEEGVVAITQALSH